MRLILQLLVMGTILANVAEGASSLADMVRVEQENFGPFASIPEDNGDAYAFVYRFIETPYIDASDPAPQPKRFTAVRVLWSPEQKAWVGRLFFKQLLDEVLVETFESDLTSEQAAEFVRRIDTSEIFNLSGQQRLRRGLGDFVGTLLAQEIYPDNHRTALRIIGFSMPANEVNNYLHHLVEELRPKQRSEPR